MSVKEKLFGNVYDLIEKGPITIVAFGDSVTFGWLDGDEADFDTVYWNRLRKKINAVSHQINVNVINAGIGGTTAAMGVKRLESQALCHNPDCIIICFGLNDVHGDINEYVNALDEIFVRCKERCDQVIFMTPNMMNTYVASDVAPELREFAAKTAQMQNGGKMDAFVDAGISSAQRAGVTVCDCYGKWKELAKTEDVTQLLVNRVNHPTREMHELFAEELFKIIL